MNKVSFMSTSFNLRKTYIQTRDLDLTWIASTIE